ncbi:catechol dioxygenase [Ophiocordyceps camponoti-floridani]|uniref:Catechol dioxygenase n=1 Tax=Ophiocordyceps camponoti-floridani TaxID=2030778 RepID=A0A8H4VCV3_9HYPO|nr:catechol dioxygenase [Ophiocordyceps camponoti-floridani]
MSCTLLGADFTEGVANACGPGATPRVRTVVSSLVHHLHAFAREVNLSTEEMMHGLRLMNWAGRMSDDKRDESLLLVDVLGLETLVDDLTLGNASATATSILGPMWRADAPIRDNGTTIGFDLPPDAEVVFMHGTVTDAVSGEPLVDAEVDVWQASTNGLYEQQDPEQRDFNLRGRFRTDASGRYSFYCIRPTAYPIPSDGPAFQLLKLMDRSGYRPAHIHLKVTAKGRKPLVTQIFDVECEYLDKDVAFAVKDELKVRFVPREGDERAELELVYDIRLAGE